MRRTRTAKSRLLCLSAILFTAGLVWFAIHTGILLWRGFIDDAQKADAIVVLGNKVEPDGTPSPRLQRRLDCAVRLHRDGAAPLVIVSGGVGREGYPEAEAMRDALIGAGIPADALIVDNEGLDTFNTARNVKRIMDARNLESVTIVSSFYHILRTRTIFRRFGIGEVYSAHAPVAFKWREVYSIAREFPAFYYYACRSLRD